MTENEPQAAPKRILIVDDHPVLRRGLVALIDFEPDLSVCAEATTCQAGLDAIRAHSPDLVIVDLELDGRGGLDLVKEMKSRYPSSPALVLSMHDEAVYAERALRAGARGYLSKRQLGPTVLAAIRCVLDGRLHISEQLRTRFAERFLSGGPRPTDSPMDMLSDRELQVFSAIGHGRTTRQIADTLSLSTKTIESHREHIKDKLGIANSAEMLQRATRWVDSEPKS